MWADSASMRVFLPFLLLAAAHAEDPFQALVRPTEALTPQEEQTKLHVPPGFSISLFASEPMINKPINMAFDSKGRLWVTSNTEYPFPAEKDRWEDATGSRVKGSRDAIKILEDTNGDHVADKVTDFADQLNVPIGVLPYGQGCIAWSIPNIWYFADTDGDGKCDQRTILFGPLGYEKDTHGNVASLRLGKDGWVYATHGFSNVSHFEVRPENLRGKKLGDPGTTLDLQSGNVFRFKPDGSAVEIFAHGQVNPFGLCWDAWGNLYSADCHSNPLTQLIKGAYYPSFGKPDDGLGFGPVFCSHTHGSTGLCGVLYLEGDMWGPEWNNHMLLGNCVTSRINHDEVTFTGATPKANERPDFLVPEDPWFRPVDMQIGPDQALYVADFYNKIIGHYEVDRKHPGRDRERGRIWRIAKDNAKVPTAPSPDQLAAQGWRNKGDKLTHEEQQQAVALLTDASKPIQLRLAVVQALGSSPANSRVPTLLTALQQAPENDPTWRHTLKIALRNCLSLPNAFSELPESSSKDEQLAQIVRAIVSPDASAWLLNYLANVPPDRDTLVKSLSSLAKNLPDSSQAKLVEFAGSQIKDNLSAQAEIVQTLLQGRSQPSPELKSWAGEISTQLLEALKPGSTSSWHGDGPIDAATFGLDTRKDGDGKEMTVLTSMPPPRSAAQEVKIGKLISAPFLRPKKISFWLCGHNGEPSSPDHHLNHVSLVECATGKVLNRAYPPRKDSGAKVDWDLSAFPETNLQIEVVDGDKGSAYAWLALGGIQPPVVSLDLPGGSQRWQQLAEIVAQAGVETLAPSLAKAFSDSDLTDSARNAIAQALQRFPNQRSLLVDLFKSSPSRLQTMLAEALASTKAGAEELCSIAPPGLLASPQLAQKLSAFNDAALNDRLAKLTKDLPPANAELDQLLAARLKGFVAAKSAGQVSAEKGAVVFQTNCALCHQIGGKGAIVGPQLDGAKNRGAERLCEDVLDPNRAVDPVFHLHILKMKDDSVLAGLQRREEGSSLVLADAAGQEHRVEKTKIAENTESPLSLMPAAFGQSIPEADFYHLLGYLLEH